MRDLVNSVHWPSGRQVVEGGWSHRKVLYEILSRMIKSWHQLKTILVVRWKDRKTEHQKSWKYKWRMFGQRINKIKQNKKLAYELE